MVQHLLLYRCKNLRQPRLAVGLGYHKRQYINNFRDKQFIAKWQYSNTSGVQLPKSLQQQIQLFTNTEPKVIPSLAKDLHNCDYWLGHGAEGYSWSFKETAQIHRGAGWISHSLIRPTSFAAESQQQCLDLSTCFHTPPLLPSVLVVLWLCTEHRSVVQGNSDFTPHFCTQHPETQRKATTAP